MEKRRYGLFTAVTMIVGIVIGSGIFFRSHHILNYTNGNVAQGILVFCIAAMAIIFGCLTIDNLAALTDKPGGFITYLDQYVGKRAASAFGWFQCFIYYPTLSVVISWVVGRFMSLLFGWELALLGQVLVGFAWFAICFGFNILSGILGGFFQNFSTIMKIIPLIVIGLLGFIFGNPAEAVFNTGQAVATEATRFGWIAAIGPISFSFDGWVISTSVAFEVKDSRKTVPRAMVIAPLCILALYLLYFIGISSYLGPEQVMALGDDSVYVAAQQLFGTGIAASAVLMLVVISVMGTVNGIILGYVRIPYSLALRGMLPGAKWLSKMNDKVNMPINSGIFAMIIALIWWFIHYFTTYFGILGNSNIADIAIAFGYLLYTVLYVTVIILWRKGVIKGIRKGLLFPVLATLGALFILIGGLQNPNFFVFVIICAISLLGGFFFIRTEKIKK